MSLPVAGTSTLLSRTLLIGATSACAALNGWSIAPLCTMLADATSACSLLDGWSASPVFDSVDYMLGAALRGYPLMTRSVINAHVTPLVLAIMTLILAGIPAAMYERIRGLKASTPVSLGIWLVSSIILLSLPAIVRMLLGTDDFS
ncbi:MAG TPA: hypothetical protein VFY92_06085 [Hyphomicrobiaceae bacterium]|nr:hypothetical protein [Hyphomicrobiaceae bacterium]